MKARFAQQSKTPERFNARVLLVEDNLVNQEVARCILELLGCTVDVAGSGIEALSALSTRGYDIVFMDIQMPKMDGFETSREIRRRERLQGSHTPIVALTANAMEGDQKRCLDAGMDDYLTKPFNRRQISAVLIRWLGGRRAETHVHGTEWSSAHRGGGVEADVEKRPSGPAVDPEVLEGIRTLGRKGSGDILSKVIKNYLDFAPGLLASLSDAVKKGDADAVQRAAHTLKSSSANLGAHNLFEMCRELEAMGRKNALEGSGRILACIEAELKRVEEALTLELKKNKGQTR